LIAGRGVQVDGETVEAEDAQLEAELMNECRVLRPSAARK
jgi:hypothetical protein